MMNCCWRSPSPTFIHDSIEPQEIKGKGFGLVATQHIPKFTTILIEKPLIQWSDYNNKEISSKADTLFTTKQISIMKQMAHANYSTINNDNNKNHLKYMVESVLDCNAFPTGLFPNIAFVNHSCSPNTEVIDNNKEYQLVNITDIEQGDEIVISYLNFHDLIKDKNHRRRKLEYQYLFECMCERCVKGDGIICQASTAIGCDGMVSFEVVVDLGNLNNYSCNVCNTTYSDNYISRVDFKVDKGINLVSKIVQEIEGISSSFYSIENGCGNLEERVRLKRLLNELFDVYQTTRLQNLLPKNHKLHEVVNMLYRRKIKLLQ